MSKLLPGLGFHCSGAREGKNDVIFFIVDDVSPTLEEALRAQALVNEDAEAFEKRYLEPLDMKREDVAVGWCTEQITSVHFAKGEEPRAIVWLGKSVPVVVAEGEQAPRDFSLPRFARSTDVWKASYRDEVVRKMRALRRFLDATGTHDAPSIRPLLKAARPHDADGISNAKIARLYKASEPKRIVYGVVLDPYQVDLQGDWIPPADIEKTAHDFVKKRGYISYQHEGMADAELVESFVEPYPTADDATKAERNEPHRAFRRKYGDDVVHSGAWVIAVKLSPALWDEYKAGKLNAFSIEGYGVRTAGTTAEMPKVTFVDLEEMR